MTSGLRSAIQFASLDRKIRQLSKLAADQKTSAMLASAKPGLVEFELGRGRLADEIGLQSECIAQGIELTARYPKTRLTDFSVSDLMEFQTVLLGPETTGLRTSSERRRRVGEAMPAQMISGALGRFFDWVRSEAFAELHPVEQMTLCQMRLSEIDPFERYSTVTCDLFAFLTLNLGVGLLPSYCSSDVEDFQTALEEALMSVVTKSLVNLNQKACEKTCDALVGLL